MFLPIEMIRISVSLHLQTRRNKALDSVPKLTPKQLIALKIVRPNLKGQEVHSLPQHTPLKDNSLVLTRGFYCRWFTMVLVSSFFQVQTQHKHSGVEQVEVWIHILKMQTVVVSLGNTLCPPGLCECEWSVSERLVIIGRADSVCFAAFSQSTAVQ